jgi:Protein of unknown function (DUF3431)
MARSWRLYLFGSVVLLATISYLRTTSHQYNPSWTSPGLVSDGKTVAQVVIAALEKDDVSWIDIGYWDVWKYEADNANAKHAVPKNKGHEAMVYLTYVLD